jgi:hypothetical protein
VSGGNFTASYYGTTPVSPSTKATLKDSTSNGSITNTYYKDAMKGGPMQDLSFSFQGESKQVAKKEAG